MVLWFYIRGVFLTINYLSIIVHGVGRRFGMSGLQEYVFCGLQQEITFLSCAKKLFNFHHLINYWLESNQQLTYGQVTHYTYITLQCSQFTTNTTVVK